MYCAEKISGSGKRMDQIKRFNFYISREKELATIRTTDALTYSNEKRENKTVQHFRRNFAFSRKQIYL
jgi:L-fucose mutarotase/ribose pyranase (RbsD/FucU family)